MTEEPAAEDESAQRERRARALNREIEALWRRGEISDAAFDWWLRAVCGV